MEVVRCYSLLRDSGRGEVTVRFIIATFCENNKQSYRLCFPRVRIGPDK